MNKEKLAMIEAQFNRTRPIENDVASYVGELIKEIKILANLAVEEHNKVCFPEIPREAYSAIIDNCVEDYTPAVMVYKGNGVYEEKTPAKYARD